MDLSARQDFEHQAGAVKKPNRRRALMITGDEFVPDLLEAVTGEVEPELSVVVDHRESKNRTVLLERDCGESVLVENRADHFHAKGNVVEEGSVPVPDQVGIGLNLPQERRLTGHTVEENRLNPRVRELARAALEKNRFFDFGMGKRTEFVDPGKAEESEA